MKKFLTYFLLIALLATFAGCNNPTPANDNSKDESNSPESTPVNTEISLTDISSMDFEFSKRDKENSFDQKDIKSPAENGDTIDITAEGTYIFTGDINKMITVSVGDEEKVQIVLDNANITNENGPCIYAKSGDKVFLTLNEGTENKISDGVDYSFVDGDSNIDGAIFSRADLTINGKGSLTVYGNTKHAIVSKDDLNIVSAKLDVESIGVALNGKDCVKISDATVTLDAGSDGIRSDNAEDENRGFVYIESGKFDITAGNDGIQAETVLKIDNAEIDIITNGGSGNVALNAEESYKGLKAVKDVIINNGKFNINATDDAIHANNSILIKNGEFNLKSSDDGIHADLDLQIANGKIAIEKCYEGLEASKVVVSGGDINISASDDGINAAGGDGSGNQNPGFGGQRPDQNGQQGQPPEGFDGSMPENMTPPEGFGGSMPEGMAPPEGFGGQQGQPPEGFDGSMPENMTPPEGFGGSIPEGMAPPEGFGGQQGQQPPQNPDASSNPEGSGSSRPSDAKPGGQRPGGFGGDMFGNGIGEVVISDGKVIINASGDGIDSNGTINITGGVTIVCGSENRGDNGIDQDKGLNISGGVLIATGGSNLLHGVTSAENQGAIMYSFSAQAAKTSVAVCDENGTALVAFTPNQSYSALTATCPELKQGNKYRIIVGANIENSDENGFARNAKASGGTTIAEFTLDTLNFNNTGNSQGGMGGGKPGRR